MDPHIWHGLLNTPPNSRGPSSSSSSPSSSSSFPSTSRTPQPSGVFRTSIPKSSSTKSNVPKSPSSLRTSTSTSKTPSTTPFQQESPTRFPSSNHPRPPLWHQVKSTMENERLLRLKCDTYRTNLSLAKVTKEKLEGKLAAAKTTMADQNKNISTLTTQLSRAHKELESSKSRLATLEKQMQASEMQRTCDALRSQVDSKTYQARVYKVALKAALKLPGVVASQVTYASLLEMTERQMQKTHDERLADKQEMERLARAQQEEQPRRDCCLAESALPRNDNTVRGLASVAADEPQTPAGTKRGAESNSDSDAAPMAKIRRLTPRQSPRRIIHDD